METIHIDTTFAIGPVKPMNAVNNGPTVKKPSGGMRRVFRRLFGTTMRAWAAANRGR